MDRETAPEPVLEPPSEDEIHASLRSASTPVWDEFCITEVDSIMYAGKPLNEVVFWNRDEKTGTFGQVELTAFRINLTRADEEEKDALGEGKLINQELWASGENCGLHDLSEHAPIPKSTGFSNDRIHDPIVFTGRSSQCPS